MKKLAVILLVLLISGTKTYSQFGLDKLKEAVQSEVTEKATEKAAETASQADGSGNKNYGEKNSDGTVADFGFTSSLHEKYKSKIVFSRNVFRSNEFSESNLANKFVFKPTEYIYFNALLDKSFYNQAIKDGQSWIATRQKDYSVFQRIYFEVNGQVVGKDDFTKYSVPLMDAEWTQFTYFNSGQRSIIDCAQGLKEHPGLVFLANAAPKLKKGENKIKMYMTFELRHPETDELYTPTQPMASGEFTLVLGNDTDLKKLLFEKGLLYKSEMEDEAIDKEITRLYKGPGKIEKIIYKESDWVINRDEYDVIKSKYLSLILITLEEGKHIASFAGLSSKYQGGGGYGKNVLDLSETRWEIPEILLK